MIIDFNTACRQEQQEPVHAAHTPPVPFGSSVPGTMPESIIDDDSYQDDEPARLFRDRPITELQVIAAAKAARGSVRRLLLPLLPPFTFTDRKHGKAYHRITKALCTLPDGFDDADFLKASKLTHPQLLLIESEDIGVDLQGGLKHLLLLRAQEASKAGYDFTAFAVAIAAIEAAGEITETDNPPPFTNLADINLDDNLAPDYLIDGVIESDSMYVVFGPGGSGKSFMMLDQGLCLATGVNWNGHSVQRGAVIYLCGEGHKGVHRRIKAWLQHNGMVQPDSFIVSDYALAFDETVLNQVVIAGKTVAERSGFPVRLVIIDTLDRHMTGDENATADMKVFVRIADQIKRAFDKSSVGIVHHTGQVNQERGRGAANLKTSLDAEIRCMGGMIEFTRMKDGAEPDPIPFRLVPVQIGLDAKDEPVTSCIMEYGIQAQKHQTQRLTRHEQHALNALITACIRENTQNAGCQYVGSMNAWREEFYRLRRIDEPDTLTNALKIQFRRARFGDDRRPGGLIEKQLVASVENGGVLLRINDNQAVNFAIIQADGTRYTTGTQAVHVPASDTVHKPVHSSLYISCVPCVPVDINEGQNQNQKNDPVPADPMAEIENILADLGAL